MKFLERKFQMKESVQTPKSQVDRKYMDSVTVLVHYVILISTH